MKILRIIARLNVGGPARHVVWLTRALEDENYSSRLIAGSVPEGEESMEYFAEENGVEPVYLREMSRELSLRDVISLFKVYRELLRFEPDLIHTHTAKAGTIGRAAAFAYRWLTLSTLVGRPRRVRMVHTFHGHVFHSYYGAAKTSLFLFIERVLARFATDRIVVISRQQLEEINTTFKVGKPKQFKVIPLGIDLEPFDVTLDARSAIRSEWKVADDQLLFGFVGRLTEIKNIPLLIEAMGRLMTTDASLSEKMKFVIVGDGQLRPELEGLVNDAGLDNEIIFAGNRTDIPAVYSALDAVVLTSLNEGTPLSLIEAMAAGKPVISSMVGGVADLLGAFEDDLDGFHRYERGLGFASGDAKGLEMCLNYLGNNEKLRNELGQNGKVFVRKFYSKERLIDDVKALYRELV
ncbi:MAG: glycosyltransferase [Acidobacteria bacterium]|nr:glycosyltransferase [Acidobacteriota bacterium]